MVTIIDHFAGERGFTQQAGYDSAAFSKKAGWWRDEASLLDPASRFAAGFDETPILQIGGLIDDQCAGERDPLPEAKADGFANNCAWMAQPLKALIQDLEAGPGTLHAVAQIVGEKHVPTIKPGASHDVVDAFINRTISKVQALPFASSPTPTTNPSPSPPAATTSPAATTQNSESSCATRRRGRRVIVVVAAALATAATAMC